MHQLSLVFNKGWLNSSFGSTSVLLHWSKDLKENQ